jgi:hypothetical protein
MTKKGTVMSIKTKAIAAAATLTLAGGATTAGALTAGTASAATPQCGQQCIQIFSAKFGTYAQPNFIETVFHGVPARGVPTILHRASATDAASDFIIPLGRPEPVSTFYADGLVSAAVNKHFGSGAAKPEDAVQVEYAPYGNPTGLCAALATTAYQNEGLSLQPCRIPATTVWIIDTNDSPKPGYFALVNGSTTDFVHPIGMVIHGNPARKRFPRIQVEHLTGNPTATPERQLWGSISGPVPS